ncbi:MAG: FAD-dependent oxidoreductase [Planctomycetota bacterium]|nr:FAD-dependent oxidoreductase [Planctomycetota bacterium]
MTRFYRVLSRRFGPLSKLSEAELREQRRTMLKASLAAGAGLLLSAGGWGVRPAAKGKRVVVVGAGFSGLACAYELKSVGYDVTVIEAQNRVGGRVLTLKDFVPGKAVEAGAELIGSNHPHWMAYAKAFGLEFVDVSEDADLDAPIVLGGKEIRGDEGAALWEAFEEAATGMNAIAAEIDPERPWTAQYAKHYDGRTLKSWIDELEATAEVKGALDANLGGDNGVRTDRMSLLAMLTQVRGGGLQRFWEETEVYRCKGGNQQLAEKLAGGLGGRVVKDLPVKEIKVGTPCTVRCADGRTIECDDVVLATPPTVWGKIKVTPDLPTTLMPQLGVNVKYLTRVKSRFWVKDGRSQYTLSDGDINWTWESTDGQAAEGPCGLTAFCAADGAARVRGRDAKARDEMMGTLFESWFPGFKDQVEDRRLIDWPGFTWTQGAYSAYAPGQITAMGPTLHKGLGNLHFAGEHCSFAFMGYMEGALHAGASLARRLAERDGVTPPAKVALPEAVMKAMEMEELKPGM